MSAATPTRSAEDLTELVSQRGAEEKSEELSLFATSQSLQQNCDPEQMQPQHVEQRWLPRDVPETDQSHLEHHLSTITQRAAQLHLVSPGFFLDWQSLGNLPHNSIQYCTQS